MSQQEKRPKKSVMLTGASTTGKSTLLEKLGEEIPGLTVVPGDTTRPLRPGEREGLDKIVISVEDFKKRHKLGWYIEEDLEFAEFAGHFYGTPRSWIDRIKGGGEKLAFISVSTEIAARIKLALGGDILWVHLVVPEDVRRERLRLRGGMGEEEIEERLTGGDSHGLVEADLMINMSEISVDEALEMIKKILYGEQEG